MASSEAVAALVVSMMCRATAGTPASATASIVNPLPAQQTQGLPVTEAAFPQYHHERPGSSMDSGIHMPLQFCKAVCSIQQLPRPGSHYSHSIRHSNGGFTRVWGLGEQAHGAVYN